MHRVLVNGAWLDAISTAGREIKNPATLAPLDTVPECGTEDIRRAVAAAKAVQPEWRSMPAGEKEALLRKVGDEVRAHEDSLARLMTQETGTPLCESFDSVGWAADSFERAGEGASAMRAGAPPPGVTAAISSCSVPLFAMARTVARAIAAGGTVVCKPPQQNPLAILKLAQIYELLPPGVVNLVTGATEAAMALIDHPDVAAIAFTGGAPLAREIAAAAAARHKEVDLHPNSVAPIIVLEDAPLDLAVAGVAWSRLRHCGQDGASRTRLYVQASIAEEFADRIHEYMAFLEVGDPMKPDTDLGPLVSLEAARRIEEQVAHAAKEGARLKLGGRCYQPWGLSGHFFQPTILTGARHGSVALREDMAGPVLLITPVADVREALHYAADCGGGHSISIYTAAPALAMQSNRAFGAGALEHIAARKPWWFPYRDRKAHRAGSHRHRDHDAGA